jgi:chromosome partitioning protein
VHCIERGLTLFDLPAPEVETDLEQWKPILHWLRPILQPAPAAVHSAHDNITAAAAPRRSAAPVLHRPTFATMRPRAPTAVALRTGESCAQPSQRRVGVATPMSRLLDALPIPRFLQRTP